MHAHPPYASAYALVQRELGPITMPEVVVSLGERVPLLPMFLPKDDRVGAALAEALSYADVALLAGNGVVSVGPDLETAYLRMELVEHYAKIVTIARGEVGEPASLSAEHKQKLLELRDKAGLHRVGPEVEPAAAEPAGNSEDLRSVVLQEIRC